MSSGSKVQKTIKKVSAEQILEERDARNNRARANMMLREQKKAMEAADEYEEPGLALKLLEKDAEEAYCKKAAKVEEKEYGAWCSEEDPHGLLGVDDLPDAGDGSDQEVKDAPDQEEKEEEMPQAHDDELPDETEDVKEEAEDANETEEPQTQAAGWNTGWNQWKQQKGGKGKWNRSKPWWAKPAWKKGKSGKKGEGKGIYDNYGGEYCHGGYRAVNGEFFPHLGFFSASLHVAVVMSTIK